MAFGGNPVFASDKKFKAGNQAPAIPVAPGFQQGYGQNGYQQGYAQPQNGYQQGYSSYGQASAEQLNAQYSMGPSSNAVMGRMTYDDVLMKTLATLGTVVLFAVVGWMIPALTFIGAIVGLVLGLVNSFKREPSKALILTYAAFEGLFVGGISHMFSTFASGIVLQAVVGTLLVFGASLALFKFAGFRATPKMTKFFIVAMVGYMLFSLSNLVMVMFGVIHDPWGMYGAKIAGIPVILLLGVVIILLAAYSFVMDFTSIENGVKNGIPAKYAWSAAFGLTVTLIWLYVEFLRILAILRNN